MDHLTKPQLDEPPLPTERRFGLMFAFILGGVSAYGLYAGWEPGILLMCLFAALALGVVAIRFPRLLAPLNRAWFALGMLLGRVVSPIVLSLLFYGLITPVALILRMRGRDELRLKARSMDSYWIDRNPPGPAQDSFTNQY